MSDTSIPQGYKRCKKCGEVKVVGEFNRNKTKSDGYQSNCKDCHRISMQRWQRNNPEKIRANVRKWQIENPEKERIRKRKWNQANAKRIHENNLRWQRNNREKVRASEHRHRTRKTNTSYAVPSNIEEILFDVQNGYCMYCQCELLNGYNIDHIIPLALADLLGKHHPGHVPSNLCLACEHCNKSKGDILLEDWLTWKYPDQMDEILQRVECHIEMMRDYELIDPSE